MVGGVVRPLLVPTLLALLVSGVSAQPADRAAALAAAYPEVDRIFTDYARDVHVPGMAWGVIVDPVGARFGSLYVTDVALSIRVSAVAPALRAIRSTVRVIRSWICVRIPSSNVRMVPSIVTLSGMMLLRTPP